MIAFYRLAPLKQCPHNPAGRAPVSLEVMTELSAGENSAVQTDQAQSIPPPARSSLEAQAPLPGPSNVRSWVARHHGPISLQVGDNDTHRIVNNQIGGDLSEEQELKR